MKIVLAAVEESLANAWEQFCGDVDGVSIHRGSILDVDCDAVVSPANSCVKFQRTTSKDGGGLVSSDENSRHREGKERAVACPHCGST